MEIITVDNLVVYCLDAEKLVKKISKIYPSTLGANKCIASNANCEGIIMVPGGYININTDACYKYSDTQLRTKGNNVDVIERIAVYFSINERTATDGGGYYTNTVARFSMLFDCADLIKNYCLPASKSLREFMGSRYNYNPRISKNVAGFISEISQLVKEE